jgi:hypothetical protein
MSDKEKYPEWGAFGIPAECATPELKLETSSCTDDNSWGLTQEVSIDPSTGIVTYRLDIDETDTKERIDDARASINREVRRAVLKSPAGQRFKLSGARDAMSAVIERARSEASDHEDVHSVWAALIAMALREDRDAPLLGMTADGLYVRYRGTGNATELFSFKMLRGRLKRQEEARKVS